MTARYRKAFSPVNGDISATGSKVDVAVRTAGSMKNDAAVAAAFATLAADASHLAGTLAAMNPPADLADDHRKLVSGLRVAAGGLARISRAAVDGDPKSARAATDAAARASSEVREPRRRIVAALDLE